MSTWNQMSSGQPWAIRSSSLDPLVWVLDNSAGVAAFTLDFVFAYVDEGWWVYDGAFEVIYHLC